MTTISNVLVDVSVEIKGNLIVKGAVVFAKTSAEFDKYITNDPNAIKLSALVGTTGYHEGDLIIENDLVYKSFDESETIPSISVDGSTIVNEYK